MKQAFVVAGVAVRELWITYRLLLILVAFIGASAIVVLLPAAPAETMDRLALGLGAATVGASSVAAWTMAAERGAGRAGWLVTRSVSRGTYLGGWLLGIGLVTVVGVIGSALLGWLTTLGLAIRIDPLAYATAVVAVVTTVTAAIALGLAVGALLRPMPAALVAAAACGISGIVILLASGGSTSVPGAAYLLFSRLTVPGSVLPDAFRAAGVGLVQTAVLFIIARAAIERAEL
jgi:hypothetical protein